MIGQNHEESYFEYINKLNYDDLIDIRNHLDREKYPVKYEIVCKKITSFESDKEFLKAKESKGKEFDSKATRLVTAIGTLVAIIAFEYISKRIFPESETSQQIGRIVFLFSVTFCVAVKTRKDFVSSLKTLNSVALIGIGISLVIGVLPRLIESGLEPAINLMLLRENMLFSPDGITYTFKSNLIVLFGYSFTCWGSWCVLLNMYKK